MYYAGDVARRGAPDQLGDESTRVDRVRRGPPTDQSSTCLFKRVITVQIRSRRENRGRPIAIQRALFEAFYKAFHRIRSRPSIMI